MPHLKSREEPFAAFKRLLLGYGLNASHLAPIIGRNENTSRDRLKRPETFTLGELRSIALKGHIPVEEIREALRF